LYAYVQQAVDKIDQIKVEFQQLEQENAKLNSDFLDDFLNVRVKLGETRQKLRVLAVETVSSVRRMKTYLTELETSPDIKLLKKYLQVMKNLVIRTDEQLKKAKIDYNDAIETLKNFEARLGKFHGELKHQQDTNSEDYQSYASDIRAAVYSSCTGVTVGMIIADIFGCFGICSASATSTCWAVGATTVETTLASYSSSLEAISERIETMKNEVTGLEGTGIKGINFLENELKHINEWEYHASEIARELAADDSAEFLAEFVSARKSFMILIDDLGEVAQKFINQPVSFYG